MNASKFFIFLDYLSYVLYQRGRRSPVVIPSVSRRSLYSSMSMTLRIIYRWRTASRFGHSNVHTFNSCSSETSYAGFRPCTTPIAPRLKTTLIAITFIDESSLGPALLLLACYRGILSQFLDAPVDWRWCMVGDEPCSVCKTANVEARPYDLQYALKR